MRLNQLIGILFGLLLATMPSFAVAYYVAPAPTGNDNNAGTQVAPFATIQKARDVVKTQTANMSADIIVYLKGGTYEQTSTLVIDQTCSGTNGHRVIFQAAPGETPIISGGRKITGWTVHDATKNIYKTSVGSLEFRQVYVNGARAIRARMPNKTNSDDKGPYYRMIRWDDGANAAIIKASEIQNLSNMNSGEAELVAQVHWRQFRFRIASYSVSGSEASVRAASPEANGINTHVSFGNNQSYHFENSLGLLDAEGEWYLDRANDIVYYKPRTGENMATAEVVVPAVEQVFKIEGTSSSYASNIVIKGITFEHSNWLLPNSNGVTDIQAHVGSNYTGMIQLRYASKVLLDGITVRRAGCQGVAFYPPTNGNKITCSKVYDISACGIVIDPVASTSGGCQNDTVSNNTVYNIGEEYTGGVGIIGTYPKNLIIEHNEVYNVRYTGISLGWGWTSSNTYLGGNIIQYNNVHNVMQLHDDGAGIYTLSYQPGTKIIENYIHHLVRSSWDGLWPLAPMYLDQQSSGFTVTSNVATDFCERYPGGGFVIIHFNQSGTNVMTYNTTTIGAAQQVIINNAGPKCVATEIKKTVRGAIPPNPYLTKGTWVSIFSPNGSLVASGAIDGAGVKNLVSPIPQGVYFVKMNNGKDTYVTKISTIKSRSLLHE